MRIILVFSILFSSSLYAQHPAALQNSMVRIFAHKQEMDVHEPWKSGSVYTEEHVGTVVSYSSAKKKGILIKASALAFAKRIEMQIHNGIERIELRPRFVDPEVNLAVLDADTNALDSLRPLLVSDRELPIEEEVHLYYYDTENHITRIHSSLRTVNFGERSDTSSYSTINYVFKVPRKELGWSEPILSNGSIVALAVGQDDEDNVHSIPGSVISHFLKDNFENYRGFPTAGLRYTNLSSPYTREALGMDKKVQGVLVVEVKPQSAFSDKVFKGDVLLILDGKKINSNGNTQHPFWGEMPAGAMLYKHYTGDKIPLEVLRSGKLLKFTGTLKRHDSNSALIPYYITEPVPYVIVGGSVFQELNRPYLRAWGKNWLGDSPSSLAYLWQFKNSLASDKNKRAIVLNQVLPDSINKGYENIGNALVESVNNVEIHSLSDLKNALKKPLVKNKESFVLVKLAHGEGDLILPTSELKAANERVSNNYGVVDSTAFFTP